MIQKSKEQLTREYNQLSLPIRSFIPFTGLNDVKHRLITATFIYKLFFKQFYVLPSTMQYRRGSYYLVESRSRRNNYQHCYRGDAVVCFFYCKCILRRLLYFLFYQYQFFSLPLLIRQLSTLHSFQLCNCIVYGLCVYCHMKCNRSTFVRILGVFSDPGSIPHNAYPPAQSVESGELLMRCGICDAFKPAKSHHCKYFLCWYYMVQSVQSLHSKNGPSLSVD